jgi:DNA-binding GntR family transcriptional regulator
MIPLDADAPRALRRLDTSNLWNRTYEVLKEKIIFRDFSVDVKISIPQIAAQLNVSRTPVRDALNRLETEGLVLTRPKVGTFVVAIDEATIHAAIDTRLMIELWTVERLKRMPAADVREVAEQLRDILAQASRAAEDDLRAYYALDFNMVFHLRFVEAGQNEFNTRTYLSATHYRLPTTAPGLVKEDEMASAMGQHNAIVRALVGRDFSSLGDLVREHLEDSRRRLVEKVNTAGGRI